jgi:hypothetical protein
VDISTVTTSSLCDEKNPLGSQLTVWCSIVEYLRTYFNSKSVLNEVEDMEWSLSPHPSPQGEPLVCESTLQEKELAPVLSSALPPTASVSDKVGSRPSASTHVPASGKPKRRSPSVTLGSLPTGSREDLLYLKVVYRIAYRKVVFHITPPQAAANICYNALGLVPS